MFRNAAQGGRWDDLFGQHLKKKKKGGLFVGKEVTTGAVVK